MKSAKLAEP